MKLGLLSKMLIFILLPVLFGTAFLSGFGFYMGDSMLREQIDQDSRLVLDTAATGLDAMFVGLREGLLPVSQNGDLLDAILAYNNGGKAALTEELMTNADNVIANFVKGSDMVYASLVIAADGYVVGHRQKGENMRGKDVGNNMSNRDYFQETLNTSQTVIRNVILPNGQIRAIMCEPIRHNGRIVGVMTARMRSEDIGKIMTDNIKIGQKGITYAYNMSGMICLHPDTAKLGKNENNRPYVQKMIQMRNGSIEHVNSFGEKKTIFFREVPKEHWILCAEIDQEEILAPTHVLLRNLALVAVALGIFIGGIIFLQARGMAKMTGGISLLADAVASGRLETNPTEDLLLQVAERRNDELSILARAMRGMITSLKKLITESNEKTAAAEEASALAKEATARAEEATRQAENAKREGMLAAAHQLEEMVNAISSAAAELSTQIEQSDRSSVESSERLTEAATAMNEMNATVQEVAQNASAASTVSNNTRINAEEGKKVLTSAMESINEVNRVSMELKEDMSKLHGHTQNISQIMNVISDIADQTNLLALNAAIEAARAGEAGRGFAVVADEVRKLAEKTMASTNDVSHAITAIQGSAQQSVNRMEEALQNVEQATTLAQQSGEALNTIVTAVEETADQVRAIATASEEQSAASEEINRSISKVSSMSTQTTQSMGEAAKAITELAQQTEHLSKLIAEMKRG